MKLYYKFQVLWQCQPTHDTWEELKQKREQIHSFEKVKLQNKLMNVEKNSILDQQQKNMREKVNYRGQQFRRFSLKKCLRIKTKEEKDFE